MGILGKIGRAISKGLEELDGVSGSAAPEGIPGSNDLPSELWSEHRQAPDGGTVDAGAPPGHIRDSRRIENLAKELTFYKRRSVEYFALIRKMEAQREEWKLLYQRDSQGHQEAQAILQEHIINLRMQVVSLVRQLNGFRQEKGEPPIDLTKLDLKAPPVGIAEETAARNAHDRASVTPQTSVEEAVAVIHAGVPVPEGVVPSDAEPPKKS